MNPLRNFPQIKSLPSRQSNPLDEKVAFRKGGILSQKSQIRRNSCFIDTLKVYRRGLGASTNKVIMP